MIPTTMNRQTVNRQTIRLPTGRSRHRIAAPPLRFTPYAWAKLLFLRDLGLTEVGGFGISAAEDLLLVEDLVLVRQNCSEVTVRFDDTAVADFFDSQVDQGRQPEQFGRIWIHTHPGTSPRPSVTDEETFGRCFAASDWSLMFILACGGRTYARLQFAAGPGGDLVLPVEVDFQGPFAATEAAAWEEEYRRCVSVDIHRWIEPHTGRRDLLLESPSAQDRLTSGSDLDPDMHSIPLETAYDRFF
jgi:hypothetical protein